jgi:16S rRNA (cytosine1402-N4)-methyltransferase
MTAVLLCSPPVPDASARHVPVLLEETLAALRPGPGRRVLDCTLGLGGHAAALVAAGATVVGVERDPAARALAHARLGDAVAIRAATFADAVEAAVAAGETFDALLADLGVSSLQLDDAGRGFSFRADARADMRMGDGCPEDAVGLIDRLDETELADVIYRYGEERLSRVIARALKWARAEGQTSAADLAAAIRRVVRGHTQSHPAVRTFQALRIAVNDELGQLDRLLAALPAVLAPGGRAAVITFHSLEDRAVKLALRAHVAAGHLTDAAKRVVVPGEAEVAANPRAGSAKLRWAVR